MSEVMNYLIWITSAICVIVTLVPFHKSPHWAVRMWEFPRLQIFAVAILALVTALILGKVLVLIPLVLVAIYQAIWIRPYTPFAKSKITIAEAQPQSDIVLISANVEMSNRNYQPTIDLVAETQPDVLFLMETDQAWMEALAPLLERYSTVLREPKDNYYGMVFATNLETESAEIVYLTDDNTPTLLSQLKTGTGDVFRFLGLHPRPPVPGDDTEARDEQLAYAARFGKVENMDLVVMGDFNDVVWSKTSHYFKHVGGYLDPRQGRGFISSFHAKYPFLRFPIDHFFVTKGVVVSSFKRGPAIGSDHFPMIAQIRFDADLASQLNIEPEHMTEEEDQRINAMVAQHRELLKQDAAK